MPKVTVLLPVYNAERYLREAVDSVLAQTYTDFELLIIDDGSTDRSKQILSTYNDARIRIIAHAANQKLIATLNEGIEEAKGEYIARMDADDFAYPERFAKQVHYLDADPSIAVCGTYYTDFRNSRVSSHLPAAADGVKAGLLFSCVLAHPSVMIRRSCLMESGLRFDPDYPHAEDYELWSRLTERYRAVNIPLALLRYRHHEGQVSAVHASIQRESMHRCQLILLRQMGLEPSLAEAQLHFSIADLAFVPALEWTQHAGEWLLKIWHANRHQPVYEHNALHALLISVWYNICSTNHEKHVPVSGLFFNSPLAKTLGIPAGHRFKFSLKYHTGFWKLRQRQKR